MRHITSYQKMRSVCAALMALCMLGFSGAALADVSQSPLFLQQSVKPNIMFTLDNSGSMDWSTLTGLDAKGEYDTQRNTRAFYSSQYNRLYYNPATTYTPGLNYDSTSMGNSTTTAATSDAYPTTGATKYTPNLTAKCYTFSNSTLGDYAAYKGSTNLLALYDPTTFAIDESTYCMASNASYDVQIRTGGTRSNPVYTTYTLTAAKTYARYAFYYVWNGTTSIASASPSDTAFPTRVDILAANYPKVSAATRTDCAAPTTTGCTYNEEIQNFANWFSFYRTRIMMAKSAMGQAFAGLDPDLSKTRFRVGFNTINGVSGTSVTYNNSAVSDGDGWLTIRDFDSTQKQAFFSRLYKINPNQGTPLRTQMDRIGQMYSKTLSGFDYTNNDPYFLNNPTDKTPVSCRASFHIMTTDGYWNDGVSGNPAYAGINVGNQDGVDALYSTKARGSYEKNSSSNSLADIAMYYYNRDIRTDLANNVPKSTDDPASLTADQQGRQRMVSFTVGLGANGTMAYDPNYQTATSGDFFNIKSTGDWPAPSGDDAKAVDDLWHAAVNARGKYFSAANPTDLKASLVETLKLIDQVTDTAATETASSSLIASGTIQYEPSFTSGVWLGHLRAYDLTTWTQKWDAATLLPAAASRNIATWDGAAGALFTWATISGSQQTALGSNDVLNYLRGDATKEKANGGAYRDRLTKLGDIVNSGPLYVKKGDDQGYSSLPTGGGSYATFSTTGYKGTRSEVIYVGANDGMLHAFDATVDLSNSGKELFAYVPASVYTNLKDLSSNSYEHRYYVDGQVTQGDAYLGASWKTVLLGSTGAGAKSVFAIDITNPAVLTKDSVMWESGSAEADMGNMLGEARAVVLSNNTWAAIYGNGYSSSSGKAVLFLKNLSDGTVYKTIGTDATTSNGLSTPALVYDKLNRVIAAYAGDLQGNLWKFDLASPTAPVVTKLFTTSTGQPITQRPVYKEHPQGGYMVMFGTGKYFDSTDGSTSDSTVQSLYGIWDNPNGSAVPPLLSKLQEQVLTGVSGGASVALASTKVASPRGWYVKLSLHSGERAIANPVMLENLFITKTLDPQGTICSAGGDSYLYGINYLTGGANAVKAFGTLDVIKLDGGGTSGLRIVQGADGKPFVQTTSFTPTQPQQTPVSPSLPGYRTWRQIPVTY